MVGSSKFLVEKRIRKQILRLFCSAEHPVKYIQAVIGMSQGLDADEAARANADDSKSSQ